MRNPPASEILNEELANLLKRKIKSSVTSLDDLGLAFDYDGEVTAADAEEILERIMALHARTLAAAAVAGKPGREEALRLFASNLKKTFHSFEPDFFQHNVQQVVHGVVRIIKGSIEIWPTLVEICYFEKNRRGLPQVRVQNERKAA
jgi:hypothetical protein